MADFSQRFEIIYKLFSDGVSSKGQSTSKRAMAKFMGIPQGRMQCWEKGQMPTANDLKLLREKFGLNYLWLIEGEGEPLEAAPLEAAPSTRPITDRLMELEKENFALKKQLADAESELREERGLNRKLTARLLIEDTTDKAAVTATVKAAGQE